MAGEGVLPFPSLAKHKYSSFEKSVKRVLPETPKDMNFGRDL
jgi:hypothetical protein